MRRIWRGPGFLSRPVLALLIGLAGLPAYAEDAILPPTPDAATEDRGDSSNDAADSFEQLPPAQDAPFAEPSPDIQDEQENSEAEPSSEAAAPSVPDPGAGIAQNAMPAANAAIKAALEARAGLPDEPGLPRWQERDAIAAFYTLRDFAPLWWRDGKPAIEAAAVIERLKHAADDGLDIKDFPESLSPGNAEEIAAADIALSDAVVAYGRQASGSRIDPRALSRLIGVVPQIPEPTAILSRVSAGGGLTPERNCAASTRRIKPMRRCAKSSSNCAAPVPELAAILPFRQALCCGPVCATRACL